MAYCHCRAWRREYHHHQQKKYYAHLQPNPNSGLELLVVASPREGSMDGENESIEARTEKIW
jgi:hypothetical protein